MTLWRGVLDIDGDAAPQNFETFALNVEGHRRTGVWVSGVKRRSGMGTMILFLFFSYEL